MNKLTREYLDSVVAERDQLKAINADMLAALDLVERHNAELKDEYQLPAEIMEQARAAIAKAKGTV